MTVNKILSVLFLGLLFINSSISFGVSFGHLRNFRCTFANSLLKDFFNLYDEIVITKLISFYLYTGDINTPENVNLTLNGTYIARTFNSSKPTRMIIHGFWNSHNSQINKALKPLYIDNFDVNLIIVSYSIISRDSCYKIARNRVGVMGRRIAMFLDNILGDDEWQWENLVIVGHSLGAHTAGVTGRSVKKGRVGTIVGLDPAYPGFENSANNPNRLSRDDAEYVECIHTNGDALGIMDPICGSDFYPNFGIKQPGCLVLISDLCSHSRAWQFFAESLTNVFIANECESLDEIRNRTFCNGTEVLMGGDEFSDKRNLTGIYFLETNDKSPFSLN